MDNSETGMNPWKDYGQAGGSNQRPSVLKSSMLPTPLWGLWFTYVAYWLIKQIDTCTKHDWLYWCLTPL